MQALDGFIEEDQELFSVMLHMQSYLSEVIMKVRGSVTVFVSIVLSVLIAFSGVMVDLSRLRAGEKHARAAVQLSVQSALSQYHAPLKENYGLMVMGYDQEELEGLIGDLLSKNLAVENRYMPGYTDLFGFEVENVTVTPMFNLSEDYVLEQQITQFMKYRAPAATIGNFLEKLRSLNTCMAQSGLLNKKMELEKKLQKIREEQVYLKLLLAERIRGFTINRKPGDELMGKLDAIQQRCDDLRQMEAAEGALDTAWKKLPELAKKISEARAVISGLESELSGLREEKSYYDKEYDTLQKQADSLEKSVDALKEEIQKLEKEISKEEGKKNPDLSRISSKKSQIEAAKQSISDLNGQISDVESEKEGVSDRIGETDQRISAKESEISETQESVKSETSALQSEVNICSGVLAGMREKAGTIQGQIAGIQGVVEKYCRYHQEAIKLINESQKGCEEAQTLTSQINDEIAAQSSESENAFLTRMKTDIKKLVLNADPSILEGLRTELDANLSALELTASQAGTAFEQMSATLNRLDEFIENVKRVPQNCQTFVREEFSPDAENTFKSLSNQITENAAGYKKPEYSVEPVINQKERNAFSGWCNRVFGEDNETDTSRDKGQQKKLKQNIRKKDEEGKASQKPFNGSDEELSDKELEKLFEGLPSWRDEDGNYPNVVNSEYTPKSSEEAALLPEEEEDGNNDIEESYGNALNRNGSIAKIIGEALVHAGEDLVKSLYVNEFIVSAFKNANLESDTRTMLLYDKQSKETFYEKAEAEYVLFGCKREKTNANLAQASIFGIRMGLNLIHVYTNTDKTASALTAATAIAGWTGFGVPVVKNLILIGWAAGESWMDVKDINAGKPVVVYKTKNTWKTDLKSLFSGVADEILKDSSKWLKQTAGEAVSDADKALQEAVADIVSSAINEAFLPLEQTVTEFGEAGDETAEPNAGGLQLPGEINSMEDLKTWITDMAYSQLEALKKESSEWTMVKLEDGKKKIQEKILKFLFESQAYKNFVEKIKGGLNDLINSGTEQIGEAVSRLGNKIADTGTTSQLVGTVVSFDYTDYLRLLLFVVPQKTKLLRCADLMQLNLRKTLDNPELLLSDYHSFVIVEADISMRYLFLPESVLQENSGQIKVRWGYGY